MASVRVGSYIPPVQHEQKSARCVFKAAKTPGEFSAEFTVYGNVDLDGDVIEKGAMLPAIEKTPDPAVVWTHLWNIPPIGETIDAKSTDTGGTASARLFVKDHEVAAQVWAGLKSGALKQFSYAFDIGEMRFREPADGEKTPRYDGQVRIIEKISDWFEWGPTLFGANPATSTLDIAKSALKYATESKGGRYDELDMMVELLTKQRESFQKHGARHNEDDLARLEQIHSLTGELLTTPDVSDVGEEGKDAPASDAVAKLLLARPSHTLPFSLS